MSEHREFGRQLREFLRGMLSLESNGEGRHGENGEISWGPRVRSESLPDLYSPQRVERFRAVPGGIDNLRLTSHDVFYIPGKGEFAVDFRGYFQVARDNPTTDRWATADVFVNMTDIRLTGESELGTMVVRRNPQFVSAGQVLAPGQESAAAKCRIAAGVTFSLQERQMTLFNKEPILLMNDAIESVPPVEDPNGKAHLYNLPLYDMNQPEGKPVAYLRSLRYTVGDYIAKGEAEELRRI